MAGIIDKLPAIQKFLVALTWKNIAKLTVFLLVIFTAWATYENRQSVYNFISQSKIRNAGIINSISEGTQKELQAAVTRLELIVAMQVTVVDFKRNIRIPIYTFIDDPEIRMLWQKSNDQHIDNEIPLFSSDVVNNKHMIDLINGEFSCIKYSDTIAGKLMGDLGGKVTTICSNGVPPFYGNFSGTVNIYLKREPTIDEYDQIRSMAKKYSALIYNIDFR